MKKIIFFGISCLVLLLITACTSVTTTPHFYSNNSNADFEILGEIVYESANRTGYSELLRAARRLYPDCDYVIDIMIDRRETTIKFFFMESVSTVTYTMRGTAIKYIW